MFSSSFTVASAPDRSWQSAMSPAPTSTAALSVFAGILLAEHPSCTAMPRAATIARNNTGIRDAIAFGNCNCILEPYAPLSKRMLKLKPQHELQLPGQTCPGVWGRHVVVVDVEVYGRGDHTEVRLG